MKNFLALLILSLPILAEVPSDSDYAEHTPYFSLSDQVNDTLGQPRMILCFMSKLRPDLMVTRTGNDYLALVNQAACDEAGQVSSGPQSSGGAASSSSNSSSTAITYTEVVVNAARASTSDPMIVKAWVPETESSAEGMMIYTYTEATAGVSDEAPFGEFLMRFTGTTLETSQDFFLGYLQASGSKLTYSEEFTDPSGGQTLVSKAVINLGDGDTGNGAVTGYSADFGFDDEGNPGLIVSTRVDVFAYNETVFCRKKVMQDGLPINDVPEKCYLTDESKGTKEVFGYFLYNSETGEKFDLPNKGFRVKYNNQYGFADGYGLHFDNETTSSLTSGLTVVRDDDDSSLNGLEYTTYFLGGKLIKKEVLKKSLASLSGLNFVAFLSSDSSLGITESAEYKMNYDADTDTFTLTGKNSCAVDGCYERPLDTEISFTSTDYLSDSSRWGIFGYMPGIGGLGISVDAMREPARALTTQEIESDVSPANFPTTLYCVENCPTYTKITALTDALGDGSQAPNEGPYANYNTFGTSAENVITYNINSETNVYTAGDGGDAIFGTLSDEVLTALSSSQFGFGAYSGALVTSLSELTCDIQEYDYCTSPAYSGAVSEYYQWVTGPQRWNQFRGLIDSYGRLVNFSRPMSIYFTAPNDADRYQEFASKELRLQYGGGDQLWGIPGGCVYDGQFTEDCINPDTGSLLPWVSKFVIRPSETTGRLYQNSGQTGDYYLTKPAFGVVFLKQANEYSDTLTLGSVDDLPSLEIVNIGPNGGSNFIGYSPNKPSTVSVVHGLSASDASAFSESDSTSDNSSTVGDNAPEFTSEDAFEVVENTTTVGTLVASDPDGDTVTYNITGFGASPFSVNTTTGVVSFREAPDYESRSSYAFTAVASDGVNSSTQSVTVSVTNANDKAPVITSARWFNYNAQFETIGSVEASDPEGDTVTFSIESDYLEIDSSTGALSFTSSPTESSYSAIVTASDGVNESTQIISVFTTGGGDGGDGGDGEPTSIQLSTIIPNSNVISLEDDVFELELIMNFSTNDGISLSNLPAPSISYNSQSNQSSGILIMPSNYDLDSGIKPSNNNSGALESLTLSNWELLSGDQNEGTLSSQGTLPLNLREGSYNIDTGEIYDSQGQTTTQVQDNIFSVVVEGNAPDLSSFEPSLREVDVSLDSANVTFVIRVTDVSGINLSRLDTPQLYANSGNTTISASGSWTLLAGDQYDGVYGASFTISTDATAADYSMYSGIFYDAHNNQKYELTNYGSSDGGLTIISNREGNVPVIETVTLSDTTIDVTQSSKTLTLTARVTDDSSVDSDRLPTPLLYGNSGNLTIEANGPWVLTSGDYTDGTYEASFTISTSAPSTIYSVYSGYFYDIYANLAYSLSDYGSGNGGVTIIGLTEGVSPVVSGVTISPNTPNVTISDATITLTVTVSDTTGVNLSNLPTPEVDQINGAVNIKGSEPWELISGDATEGTYRASIIIPMETVPGAYRVFTGYFYDIFDNLAYDTSGGYGVDEGGFDVYYEPGLVYTGTAIDGYLSGADVFIDQNFNFKFDEGEFSGTTNSDGEFAIGVNNEGQYQCLANRPIIVDVPVGAIDSTLGVVENAYQMVLPSINDTGVNSIIISPFTSLLGNAILEGKSNSSLTEDLTVAEGCESAGDNVASNITSALEDLYTSIETNFGIDKQTLLSDFIVNPADNVTEVIAQNIASLFPYLKQIDNQVSDFLTERFEKDIRANVALSSDALDIIFGNEGYDKLPLSFSSRYETERNSAGWYQTEELSASNGYISNEGVLSREHCSATDIVGCDITDITLNNVANTSTQYSKQSNFFNNDISIAGLKAGSLAVYSNDSRSWRDGSVGWQESGSRARECQGTDDIQFKVTGNNKLKNFHYSSYSQGYMQLDCSNYRKYYYPKLNVATIFDQSVNDNSIQVNYYIPDVLRSGVVSEPPFDFVANRLTIDPADVILEMSQLPTFYSQVDEIRRKFVGEEYLLFEYHHDPYITYFEMGTFPRNDMYWDPETLGDNRLYGQDARDAFFARLQSEVTFDSEVYGSTAPTNTSVLGRIAESYLEIVDYNNEGPITLPVYPTYEASTKTLNLSLNNSELNLNNLKDFIRNGINGNPVTANVYYNPDDSISGTIPVALYLYKGTDTIADVGEAYFSIEFELEVSSTQGDYENPVNRTAIQTFVIKEDAVIVAKYVEGDITISRNITNGDLDRITIEDQVSGQSPLAQPETLELKVLGLISKVADKIDGIQSFFDEGGEYTYKLDLGTGGHSLVDFARNTVDIIEGTFKVSTEPEYAINVNDIIVHEGTTENLCFYRPAAGDLSATSFELSFTPGERPGRGALADDFELSSDTVIFDVAQTSSCITVTGVLDNHFDWGHDAYLDISNPSNGQPLSRNRVKIRIVDYWGQWNRISFKNR